MKRDKYGYGRHYSLFGYKVPNFDFPHHYVYVNEVEYRSWKPRIVLERYGFGFVWFGWHVVFWPKNDMRPIALYKHQDWVDPSSEKRAELRDLRERKEEVIPRGMYCHSYEGGRGDFCPFWDIDEARPYQDNGYCHLIHEGDWIMGGGLLWDQCKECSVNDEDEEYEAALEGGAGNEQ